MKTIFAYLRLIRIANLLFIAFSLSLFYYLIIVPVHHNLLYTSLVPFTDFEFFLFVISVAFVAGAGNAINDYYDFKVDKISKPNRPLPAGNISLDNAVFLHGALAFSGIGIGFYLGYTSNNFKLGYIYVVCVLLLYLYAAYLKKIALVGNLVVAALTGFMFLLLMLFEVNLLNTITFDNSAFAFAAILWQVKFYAGFAFITNLAREIVKDLEDAEADDECNIDTLPVQFGTGITKAVLSVVMLTMLGGLGYVIYQFKTANATPQMLYMLIAVAVPATAVWVYSLVAKTPEQYKRAASALKIVMLLGVLSIPVFYLINQQ